MRFKPLKLYADQKTGEDVLGNPITEPVLIGLYEGLVTSWTTEEIALLDRDVTRTQRKLLTDAPVDIIRQADSIDLEGERYHDIEIRTDTVRWRICHIKDYFQ
ncbi:hypothetical protein DHX103_14450 [Planococcus sp. X10-3]|uniref:hypothetical protein n=1 Tax=Planococcus sp. X10-3 TaxID=3061240 RepID=UPI003BB14C13